MKTFPTMSALLRETVLRETRIPTETSYKQIVMDPAARQWDFYGNDSSVDTAVIDARKASSQHPNDGLTDEQLQVLRTVLPAGEFVRFLGRGVYGHAFEYKPDRGHNFAVKCAEDGGDIYRIMHQAKQRLPNKIADHLPQIFAAWKGPWSLVVSIMEVLEPLPPLFSTLIRAAQDGGHVPDHGGGEGPWRGEAYVGVTAFFDAMRSPELRKFAFADDLHPRNIMIRPSDNKLVAVDIGGFWNPA